MHGMLNPTNPIGMTPGTLATGKAQSADMLRQLSQAKTLASDSDGSEPLREAFQDFVGQTLFGSMLSAMRSTTGKSAYMHGGRAEEIFQEQMDQYLVQDLSDASADKLADPMFDLFNMQRRA